MTPAEAKLILRKHILPNEELPWENPDARSTSLLGSLRPYRGSLIEDHYHEIMGALQALTTVLQGPIIDRELMSYLWTLVFLIDTWALDPSGMLQRNDLIAPAEQRLIRGWVRTIQWAVKCLLAGMPRQAFDHYERGRTWC